MYLTHIKRFKSLLFSRTTLTVLFCYLLGFTFYARMPIPPADKCFNDSVCIWLSKSLGDKTVFILEAYISEYTFLFIFLQ